MRVLHVIPSVSLSVGGPSVVVRTLAKGLSEAGIQVTIATVTDTNDVYTPLQLPVHEDNYTTWHFRRTTNFYTTSLPLTRWLARKSSEFDLFHIHGLFSYPVVAAAFWADRYRIPYIIRPYGTLNRWGMQNRRPYLKKCSVRLIESIILRRAKFIQFTSLQEEREAIEQGIRGRSTVISNGLDLRQFQNLPADRAFLQNFPHLKGKRIVLYMSRLDPIKGIELLFEAVARLRNTMPNIALVVAGRGSPEYEQSLKQSVQELNIEEVVSWVGFLEGQKKLEVWAAAELFALPSYSENFGVAVVEAMAAKLPVIISEQVGISELVLSAKAGVVVQTDAQQVAQAMKQLLTNSDIRAEVVANAQCLVKEQFSTESTIGKLLDIYEKAIEVSH